MPQYTSATPNYASGPKTYSDRTQAYATGLREYGRNPFAGTAPANPTTAMAPHLSQASPVDQDIMAAYKQFMTDPTAQQYGQHGADLEKLWRLSPKSPVFQPGYAHNPYIMQRAGELRSTRETQAMLAAMTPEERQAYEWQQQAANSGSTYSGE